MKDPEIIVELPFTVRSMEYEEFDGTIKAELVSQRDTTSMTAKGGRLHMTLPRGTEMRVGHTYVLRLDKQWEGPGLE